MIHPDSPQFSRLTILDQDHLTLLNGICSSHPKVDCLCSVAYNAFTKYGRSSSWCKAHALNFRAMSRAVSIRSQLKKYMIRFNLPLQSCEGDAKRLRQCLVSGYWRNGARWVADGTYRSVKGNKVGDPTRCTTFTLFTQADSICPPNICAFHSEVADWMGGLPRSGRNQEDTVCLPTCMMGCKLHLLAG